MAGLLGLLLGMTLAAIVAAAVSLSLPGTPGGSLLARFRPRTEALTLDPEHPLACRCKGRGVNELGEVCPMVWASYEAPPPRWLVGRITRGSHR